jgi:hypothetical protein
MAIMFNSLLTDAGIPLTDVRLLRHKDSRSKRGFTPYELWRDDLNKFELYQSTQSKKNRSKLKAPYWAVFVGTLDERTMFVGLYSVKYSGLLKEDTPKPHRDGIDKARSCDVYKLDLLEIHKDFIGKLFIDWGPGALAWVQYADRNNKPIIELRKEVKERDFPGYLNFIEPLSKLDSLPVSWATTLKIARGVYLLTCPKTKEQYVGSACGEQGFWGRWQDYVNNSHGGNKVLKSRDPSDYQVCILEVAGSSASNEDILSMESRWKLKLQSREMGLNKN